jgi:hypothetical protein
MRVEELDEQLNLLGVPSFEAVATEGSGIYETFQGIARLLYLELKKRFEGAGAVQTDGEAEGEIPSDNAGEKMVQASVPGTDGGREMKHPASEPSHSIPSVPPSSGEAQDGLPDPDEEHETVSFVVDQALREVDSVPEGEERPDAAAEPPPDRTEEGDDYRFAPMNGMENELGRVLELDDTPKPVEPKGKGRNDADRNGFIKDPCRTTTGEDKSSGDGADRVQVEIEAVHDPVSDPVRETPAASEPVFTVPIVISRSQVRKTVPMKLMLEIRITEDDI